MSCSLHRTRSVAERLWARVNRDGPVPGEDPSLGKCWQWLGGTHVSGKSGSSRYGTIGVRGDEDSRWKSEYVHRVAFELAYGPIPKGLTVDHLCFNTLCCNPAHLRLLTPSENASRSSAAWAKKVSKGGHRVNACINGHPYTPENSYFNAKSGRTCKQCNRESSARKRLKQRARSPLGCLKTQAVSDVPAGPVVIDRDRRGSR